MPRLERTEMLRVRLRPTEADKLRELAAQDDEPVSAVVRRAIRRYVEDTEGSPAASERGGRDGTS